MVKVSKKSIKKFIESTNFSPVPFSQLTKQFAASAGGGDELSQDQFCSVARIVFKTEETELLNSIFEYLDLDDSGTIDPGELLCALNIFCSGSVDEKIAGCFTAFDLNGDGVLQRDEFDGMLRTTLVTSRDLLVDLLGHFAGDENPETAETVSLKSLQSDEVDVLADAAFEQADENGDGVISLDEFQNWAKNQDMSDFFSTFNQLFGHLR